MVSHHVLTTAPRDAIFIIHFVLTSKSGIVYLKLISEVIRGYLRSIFTKRINFLNLKIRSKGHHFCMDTYMNPRDNIGYITINLKYIRDQNPILNVFFKTITFDYALLSEPRVMIVGMYTQNTTNQH